MFNDYTTGIIILSLIVYFLFIFPRALYMHRFYYHQRLIVDNDKHHIIFSDLLLYIPFVGCFKVLNDIGRDILKWINLGIIALIFILYTCDLIGMSFNGNIFFFFYYLKIFSMIMLILFVPINCYSIISVFGAEGLYTAACIFPLIAYMLTDVYPKRYCYQNKDILKGTFNSYD